MPNVRIEFAENKGERKPKAAGVAVFKGKVTHIELVKQAKRKLGLHGKKGSARLRLFLGNDKAERYDPQYKRGYEITPQSILGEIFQDAGGLIVIASRDGRDYLVPGGQHHPSTSSSEVVRSGKEGSQLGASSAATTKEHLLQIARDAKLPHPPRHPYPLAALADSMRTSAAHVSLSSDGDVNEVVHSSHANTAELPDKDEVDDFRTVMTAKPSPLQRDYPMSGIFPIFERGKNVLPLIREAVKQEPLIREYRRSVSIHHPSHDAQGKITPKMKEIIFFDYSGDHGGPAFPDPNSVRRSEIVRRWQMAVQRECRGLVLDGATGEVLARRFHKFFNLNERDETSLDRVVDKAAESMIARKGDADLNTSDESTSDVITITEKLDGELCSPILLPENDGTVIWATRTTRQEEIEEYVRTNDKQYHYDALARFCLGELNVTPLFEYTPSSRVVGVLSHGTTALTLLALRDNETGEYKSRTFVSSLQERFPEIPFVELCTWQTEESEPEAQLKLFEKQVTEDWIGREGVVICFADGSHYKLKARWYVSMAAATVTGGKKNFFFLPEVLKSIPIQNVPVTKVWTAVLSDYGDKKDDVTSAIVGALQRQQETRQGLADDTEPLAASFLRFQRSVETGIDQLIADFALWAMDVVDMVDAVSGAVVEFAEEDGGWPPDFTRAVLRRDWEGAKQSVRGFLLAMAKDSSKLEGVERIIGIQWVSRGDMKMGLSEDEEGKVESRRINRLACVVPDEVLPDSFTRFDETPGTDEGVNAAELQEHVVGDYLEAKWDRLCGAFMPHGARNDDILCIPRGYQPVEGKITGLWEQFSPLSKPTKLVYDLRLDLQPMCHAGYTPHYGSAEYALLLVQYGLFPTDRRARQYPRGDIAGVLLPTETGIELSHVSEALRLSFRTRNMVKVQRRLLFLDEGASVGARPQAELNWKKSHDSSTSIREPDNNRTSYQLFCDLDGVLADFSGGVRKLTGKSAEELSKGPERDVKKMWGIIGSQKGFWSGLDWMPGAEAMWDAFLDILDVSKQELGEGFDVEEDGKPNNGNRVQILTGLPSNCRSNVKKEKSKWCREKLGMHPDKVATCMASDKAQLASGKGRILIDDNIKLGEEWTQYGGIFIHHVSPARTLYELRRTVGKLDRWYREELEGTVYPLDFRPMYNDNALKCSVVSPSGILASSVTIHDVAREWPRELLLAKVVGLDAEWSSSDLSSGISLVQIAMFSNESDVDAEDGMPRCDVYLIDMLQAGWAVREGLSLLFGDENVLKVGFAMASDVQLLGGLNLPCEWLKSVVDLLEAARDPLLQIEQRFALKGNTISFETFVGKVLGLRLSDDTNDHCGFKSKSLQDSDWNVRPLTQRQRDYAALDAILALQSYKHLRTQHPLVKRGALQPKHIHLPQRKRHGAASQLQEEPSANLGNVVPLYTAVYLSPASKEKLLARFPPSYGTSADQSGKGTRICADHVTLAAHPSVRELIDRDYFAVFGKECEILVDTSLGRLDSSVATNSHPQVDAVRVSALHVVEDTAGRLGQDLLPFVNSGFPHITLSVGTGTSPMQALELFTAPTERDLLCEKGEDKKDSASEQSSPPLRLSGVLGITAEVGEVDQLGGLSSVALAERIRDFERDPSIQPGAQLTFKATEMNARDRKIVHEYCESRFGDGSGLSSWSEGQKKREDRAKSKTRDAGSSGRQLTIKKQKAFVDETIPQGESFRTFTSGADAVDEKLLAKLSREEAKKTRRITDLSRLMQAMPQLREEASPAWGLVHAKMETSQVPAALRDHDNNENGSVSPSDEEQELVTYDGDVCVVTSGPDDSNCSLELSPSALDTIRRAKVVIMRGMPGSGKSTVARELISNPQLNSDEGSNKIGVVVSADTFFETGGRGKLLKKKIVKEKDLSKDEIYDLCFDQTHLNDAHEDCFQRFEKRLEGLVLGSQSVQKIVVDNTNSQGREWKRYTKQFQRQVEKAGCDATVSQGDLIIVEIDTPTKQDAVSFNKRSAHKVPLQTSLRMFDRWEDIGEANRSFEHILLRSVNKQETNIQTKRTVVEQRSPSVALIDEIPLPAWIHQQHLVLPNRSGATHMDMKRVQFLKVPVKLMDEFIARYSRAVGTSESAYPQFLSEVIPEEGQPFRPFFDIDLKVSLAGMDEGVILRTLANAASNLCTKAKNNIATRVQDVSVFITGYIPSVSRSGESSALMEEKVGFHLTLPRMTVRCRGDAARLRKLLVEELGKAESKQQAGLVNWDEVIDGTVYSAGGGLRLLGSRKITKGVDHRRTYFPLAAVVSGEFESFVEMGGLFDHGRIAEWLSYEDAVRLASIHVLGGRGKTPETR